MSRALVDAPPATPPRYGLIAAAPIVNNSDLRWADGWRFAPEGCGSSGRILASCGGDTETLTPAANPAVVEGDPLVLWASDRCSTFGFNTRDYAGRARRQLEATQSFQLAAELWTGSLLDTAPDPSNRALVDVASDTVTEGPASEVGALACLVAGLATCGKGRRGMVHVTSQLLTHLVSMHAVYREGNLWLTAEGHIVVADAGYDGSGPGGVPASESQWAYATSMVQVFLGPIEVLPGTFEDAQSQAAAVNRSVNTVTIYAERMAGYQWDECCHLAAEVDLPVCLIGGAS